MNEIDAELLRYAQVFDEVIDLTMPTLIGTSEQRHSFRHKSAGKLQEHLFTVAKSINKLTKIAAKVDMKAVDDNSQSILALCRVLVELCNKLNYLALSPTSDQELKLRTLYFSLVGAVNYKKLLGTVDNSTPSAPDPERDKQFAIVDKIIAQRKNDLAKAGFQKWSAFTALTPKMRKRALKGETQDDYLKGDFEKCLSQRLNPNEKKHFQDLGSVAVHSSAFVLFFHNKTDDNQSFITGLACLALYNASRHLALCTLEAINRFPELKDTLSVEAGADLTQLARGIKQKNYLYV